MIKAQFEKTNELALYIAVSVLISISLVSIIYKGSYIEAMVIIGSYWVRDTILNRNRERSLKEIKKTYDDLIKVQHNVIAELNKIISEGESNEASIKRVLESQRFTKT